MAAEQDKQGRFEFIERPNVEGVTPSIISNLDDIVRRFGQIDPEDQVVRFHSGDLGLNHQLILSTSIKPENKILIVSKSPIMQGGAEILRTNDRTIIWDKTLTGGEAEQTISRIDDLAKEAGLIDPETGDRKPIPPEISVGKFQKYKVEEVFSKPGDSFMVLPGEDPQKYLSQFDQPERLIVLQNPIGGITINLKDDLPYIQERLETIMQILRERRIDINNPKHLDRITPALLIKIRTEAERRLNRRKKK